MKSYFSIKPGATFFLGSSRTLVYHKDDVEIIYKTKTPSGKTYYAHVYLMLGGENSVTLLAPTYLPFHPLVELGLDKFLDAVNKLCRTQFPLSPETLERPTGSCMGTRNKIK